MFTPGSGNKFLFATLGGRLFEVGDYSSRGDYSSIYGILNYQKIIVKFLYSISPSLRYTYVC